MPKYKVTYELRDKFKRIVEADSPEEAEQIICDECWARHHSDVYDICDVEELKDV